MGTKQSELARQEREAWTILAMAMELVAELSEKGNQKDLVQKATERMQRAFDVHRPLYEKRMIEELGVPK
jgi:hypothetical protein